MSIQSSECEVTLEDQTLINRFARLNAKCEELESDLLQKKRQLSNTEEALLELEISEDTVLVQCGEVFAQMPEEGATKWCSDIKQGLETYCQEIEFLVSTMKEEMTEIKAKLYAKFGQNINLEYDDQ